jgi:hypothetical protein
MMQAEKAAALTGEERGGRRFLKEQDQRED